MVLDPATFDALYAAQAGRLYSSCYRILRDEQQAQDAVQETWVRAFSRDDSAPIANPAAWLTTVARNLALDQYRRRRRLAPLAEEAEGDEATAPQLVEDDPYSDPAKAVPADDQEQLALALIDELRPEQGRLLQLHYVDGMAIPELAAIIGKTANATTVALHRARAALRARYVDHVFARAALPDVCRTRKSELVAAASGAPPGAELAAHLGTCPHCKETAAELRSMSAPWAAAPLLLVPSVLKATVVGALAAHGVATGAGAVATAGAAPTGVASGSSGGAAHAGLVAKVVGVGALGIVAMAVALSLPAASGYALPLPTEETRFALTQIRSGEGVPVSVAITNTMWFSLPDSWATVTASEAPAAESFTSWRATRPDIPEDAATMLASDLSQPGFAFFAFDPHGAKDGVTPQVSAVWVDKPAGDIEDWLASQATALANVYDLASPPDLLPIPTNLGVAIDACLLKYWYSANAVAVAGSRMIVPMPDNRGLIFTVTRNASEPDPFGWAEDSALTFQFGAD